MNLSQLKKTILNNVESIWSHRIVNAVLKGVTIYISVSMVFGILYYFFDSLDFKQATGSNTVRFLDYIYFSAVTFTTIGYGDIIPKAGEGQVCES
jgi:hypothetical protein